MGGKYKPEVNYNPGPGQYDHGAQQDMSNTQAVNIRFSN